MEGWINGGKEGTNKGGRKEEVSKDGMHKGRRKRGRKECRGKEGRINRQRKGFLGHLLKCRGVSKLRGSPTQNRG